jgi:hypothetical protein
VHPTALANAAKFASPPFRILNPTGRLNSSHNQLISNNYFLNFFQCLLQAKPSDIRVGTKLGDIRSFFDFVRTKNTFTDVSQTHPAQRPDRLRNHGLAIDFVI